MTVPDSERTVATRDHLRAQLDVLSQYDRVLREQLKALEEEDLDHFAQLGYERERLGDQLASLNVRPEPQTQDLQEDAEIGRLIAEIQYRSNELRDLDGRVLGVLAAQRGELKTEIDRASAPVPGGAVRYMEAESGPAGTDRLDIVL